MNYDDEKQAWDDFWKGRGAIIAAIIISALLLSILWDTIAGLF